MKNVFLASICFISLALVSCETTKTAEVTENKADVAAAPEQKLEQNDFPGQAEITATAREQEAITLPYLENFEEPEVITLPPADIKIEEQEDTQEQEVIQPEESLEELITVDVEKLPELPIPEIEVITEQLPQFDLLQENEEVETKIELPVSNGFVSDGFVSDEIKTGKDIQLSINGEIPNKEELSVIEEVQDKEELSEKEELTLNKETEEIFTEENQNTVVENVNQGQEKQTNPEEKYVEKETFIPSRTVTLKRREYVDITYPGTGWIFMGITDNSRDITYFGRSLGSKDTKFSFQAKNAGTKILHFYKNDNLTGEYIDDYIEIVVLDQIGSNKTHIKAPDYKQPLPEKSKELFFTQNSKNEEETSLSNKDIKESSKTSSYEENKADDQRTADSIISENDQEVILIEEEQEVNIPDTETLLQEAQLLYNEKEYELAYEKIQDFLLYANKKVDEGLFLKGKILEANSQIQDIKSAIDAYTKLTKKYPASRYWNEANKRIVYLKRFYMEVR